MIRVLRETHEAGDTCFSLAGVYNAVVVEQNVCTLAPAASFGYVFKKDSNGNYPDNDEIYGNDCETSSTASGQICYNIVGALSITFGPNNRAKKSITACNFPPTAQPTASTCSIPIFR